MVHPLMSIAYVIKGLDKSAKPVDVEVAFNGDRIEFEVDGASFWMDNAVLDDNLAKLQDNEGVLVFKSIDDPSNKFTISTRSIEQTRRLHG